MQLPFAPDLLRPVSSFRTEMRQIPGRALSPRYFSTRRCFHEGARVSFHGSVNRR
ncbi:hypothetical protein SZ54_2937 [Rhizobium sp. UR51a]|nr:hypothetical protein SZ54_2937 [Rhizobium sp. UR51a]